MKTNEPNPKEDQLLKQLMDDSQFDDSISEDHRLELRNQALRMFDQAQLDAPVVRPASGKSMIWQASIWVAAIAAAVAVGSLAVSSHWFSDTSDSGNSASVIANRLYVEPNLGDSTLLETLAEIDAWREEVSPDAYFQALAMAQEVHQAEQLENTQMRMRLYYESSL